MAAVNFIKTPAGMSGHFRRLREVVREQVLLPLVSGETLSIRQAKEAQLVNERLKLVDRLRTAAAKRIERAWMNDEAGCDPLSQLIGLIDETAHASRVSLS